MGHVLFLPYLAGERTPHNDTDIRAAFLGLAADAMDTAQAVLEGTAFSLLDGCQALASAGCDFDAPGFIGRGARSVFWGRLVATVLGRPLVRYEDADLGPALGAARLGMVASGEATVEEAARPPSRATAIEPDRDAHRAYADRHPAFQGVYRAIKGLL